MGNVEDRERPSDADSDEWDDGSGEALEEMIEHADRASGAESFGTTADEQERGEPFDARLAEERTDRPILDTDLGLIDEDGPDDESEMVGEAIGERDPFVAPEECGDVGARARRGAVDPDDDIERDDAVRLPSTARASSDRAPRSSPTAWRRSRRSETLRRLGIDHAQGNYLAPPGQIPNGGGTWGAHDAWRRSFDHYLTKPCRICVFYRGTLHLAEDVVDGRADGRHGIDWHAKGGCRPARDRPARDPRMQCRRAHQRKRPSRPHAVGESG